MEPDSPPSSQECQLHDGQEDLSASSQSHRFPPGEMPDGMDVAHPGPVVRVLNGPQLFEQQKAIARGTALVFLMLLCVLLLQVLNAGGVQFIGPQGWAYVLGGPSNSGNTSLLQNLPRTALRSGNSGGKTQAAQSGQNTQSTPEEYVDQIVGRMTLDQKLGQMMFVQFVGPDYSLALSTMISQDNVGAVLLFSANNNIVSKDQLTSLTQQMQHNSTLLPLAIATDQEGGAVDRLQALDGPRPAAATLGATNDPAQAQAAGVQDAQALSAYGINLNLAPVVDVDNLSTSEMHRDMRTFGTDAQGVVKMAGAYLKGLQQSGKVVGTLKHFPGLGDVGIDPHFGIPSLRRSKAEMEQIDWEPYHALIQQGLAHVIMVTHELVPAIDDTRPSSLSPKIVQGILRDEMGFQGVIMTDSLTMTGVTEYYTPGQAAALAIEAGSDLLMGASSPDEVATMIDGIKQAITSGAISQQRIDDSVRRILMMKYAMGLLPIPEN